MQEYDEHLGKLAKITWRDSYTEGNTGGNNIDDMRTDCVWESYGIIVKDTDLFLSIAGGSEKTQTGMYDHILSIPWTQILEWEEV